MRCRVSVEKWLATKIIASSFRWSRHLCKLESTLAGKEPGIIFGSREKASDRGQDWAYLGTASHPVCLPTDTNGHSLWWLESDLENHMHWVMWHGAWEKKSPSFLLSCRPFPQRTLPSTEGHKKPDEWKHWGKFQDQIVSVHFFLNVIYSFSNLHQGRSHPKAMAPQSHCVHMSWPGGREVVADSV